MDKGGILSAVHYILTLLVFSTACKPLPEERHFMPGADPARGLKAIERAGCGACHTIPGLSWPRGRIAPELGGIAEQNLIAGTLPNRPNVLAAYVRNAPALISGSVMPAMPVTEDEARDIASYLYSLPAR